jgi:hypothetical protein
MCSQNARSPILRGPNKDRFADAVRFRFLRNPFKVLTDSNDSRLVLRENHPTVWRCVSQSLHTWRHGGRPHCFQYTNLKGQIIHRQSSGES